MCLNVSVRKKVLLCECAPPLQKASAAKNISCNWINASDMASSHRDQFHPALHSPLGSKTWHDHSPGTQIVPGLCKSRTNAGIGLPKRSEERGHDPITGQQNRPCVHGGKWIPSFAKGWCCDCALPALLEALCLPEEFPPAQCLSVLPTTIICDIQTQSDPSHRHTLRVPICPVSCCRKSSLTYMALQSLEK